MGFLFHVVDWRLMRPVGRGPGGRAEVVRSERPLAIELALHFVDTVFPCMNGDGTLNSASIQGLH